MISLEKYKWVYNNLEDIGGIVACGYVIMKVPMKNELIHSIMSILTAIISAFLIHLLKNYFSNFTNFVNKKIKNEKANRKHIK